MASSSSSTSSASASSSSSTYLPNSLAFLISNFQSFVTIKLENSNYFAWKTQIENALKATDLFGYVDGTVVIPPTHLVDSSGVKTLNPDFAQWNTIDRMLLSCLIATLTPSILPHIVGSEHTFQLLSKLEEKFSILSRSHVHDLRRRLFSLNKTGSMDSYLDSIKEIVQKLASSGSQVDDEELIFHTLNGLKTGYKSFKQTIRTRTEPLSFGTFSSMLLAEELHVSQEEDITSTILVAPHQNSSSSNSIVGSSSSSGLLPTPSSISTQVPPPPFQFPFPNSSSQNYLPSFQGNYNGPRFNRNNNRFRGNQFPRPFVSPSPGSFGWNGPGNSGWNGSRWHGSASSGFQGNSGWSQPPSFDFQHSSDFPGRSSFQHSSGLGGMFNASCQICGKNNHQANTCRHRANLGYRPFGHFGRSPFGQSPSFPNMSQMGTSSGSSFQAFYAFSDPMGYYGTSSCFDQPAYALNMTGYGHNGASSSQMPGMPMTNEASSSGYGYGSSAPPWYFDSGATSHVTLDASHISVPTGVSNNASVTVGNGQNIPVAHSGQNHSPGSSHGDMSQRTLPPSSFF